jgi:polar amino acid transport system substrate-binding protein
LAGKTIGVQTDTTGWIYADAEINEGVLKETRTELKTFDNAQLAADGIGANLVEVVIIDELPAKYITEKNSGLKCLPLYYDGGEDGEDSPTEEQYAICVTKGNDALLKAINEVLEDLMKEGADGKTEIDRMLMKHMGLE